MGAVENSVVVSQTHISAGDEPRVLCIIHNTQNAENKLTMNLPSSTSCEQLISEVANKLNVACNAVELYYESPVTGDNDQNQIPVHSLPDKNLGELCAGGSSRNKFFVCIKDGQNLVAAPPDSSDTPSNIINEATTTVMRASADNKDIYNSDTYAQNTSGTSSYSSASSVLKSDTGYVGLVNQAMTCYLNSLLQTLYMTPEFRNAVYRWEHEGNGDEAVKSIPYQLQRLFLQLQTSTKRAVETTDITRSFGWDSSEAWQQHDVQELCRVMFDALEKNWKNTDQANLITQLYQGKIKDYVKCLKCGSESARTDTYLDIPLVVRPFGANIGYSSVEEALHAFVEHEILSGTNQYFCEKCNCKCDAHKGLKFLTFPYLLTLQLKRFDFDYSTMHRIKLNDRMSFPERLELAQFIDGENEKDALLSKEAGDATGLGEHRESGVSGCCPTSADTPPDEAVDEGIDIGEGATGTSGTGSSDVTRMPSDFSDAGRHGATPHVSNEVEPFVYELFSIMVHSGGASGGHYYAYIKSFKDQQWYSFNDQHVYRIMQDDIEKTFGGSSYGNSYYSSYSSSANAYMLMYRQIDPTRNKDFMQQEDFPPHLKKELQGLKMREEEEFAQKELERNTCKIKLYYLDFDTQRYVESKLEVHKNKTLAEATDIAYKQLRPPGIKLSDFRLVKFDSVHEYIERSFDNELSLPIYQVLGGVKSVYNFDLLAETKFPCEEFTSYNSGDFMIRVHNVDLTTELIGFPQIIRASPSSTVAELKQIIATKLKLPANSMRCVIEKYYNHLCLLDVPTSTLHAEGFQKTNKMFIECTCPADGELKFSNSRLYALLDRHQHTMRLSVSVPKMPYSLRKVCLAPRSDDGLDYATAGDSRSTDMDEGIGESEVDVQSNAAVDTDPTCPLTCPSSVSDQAPAASATSTLTVVDSLQGQKELMSGIVGNSLPGSDVNVSSVSAGTVADDTVLQEDDEQFEAVDSHLFVDTSITGNIEASGGQDEDVGSPSLYVRSASQSLSQDSGSSQTVEVGDDSHTASPSPVDDFDHPESSSPSPPPSPPANNDISGNPTMLPFDDGTSCLPPSQLNAGCGDVDDDAKDAATAKESGEDWDRDTLDLKADDQVVPESDGNYYCFVEPTVFPLGYERTLTVHVDRRISLKALKAALESFVGVDSDNFKVYKVSQSGQEIEETRSSETLNNYPNDAQINIKYGRALKLGEYRVQVYQLVVNDPEPMKFMVEVILARGMTVLDAKKVIVEELEAQRQLKVDVSRCRLRRKNWKMPSHIHTNNLALLDDGLSSALNPEILFEILDGDENLPAEREPNHLSIYVRRWWPSKYQIDPFHEIFVDNPTIENTLSKISALSDIPVNNICIAKPKGTFPYDISVIEVDKDMDWDPNVSQISQWPLSIVDDGAVLFYKDRMEELMELSDEQKKQLQQRENSRLMKHNTSSVPYLHRKERALKIYTVDSPTLKPKNSATSAADPLPLD
jgi:ubiquitin C-terminal hydrolase